MKLQFEPYVLEPFDDFYKFPHEQKEEQARNLIHRDYQMDLARLRQDHAMQLADRQRWHQQEIAELHNYFAQKMADGTAT
jgi:hypothetical protein